MRILEADAFTQQGLTEAAFLESFLFGSFSQGSLEIIVSPCLGLP